MNFLSMEYFITIAQERSFTKAAGKLHLTQQSLSAHIAGLEKELGCPLLVRHIPLELTYAGKIMLQYAKTFQRQYKTMQQEFCDITENQKGLLRIGIASTRGRTILPRIIAVFQKEFPNIIVEITEAANDILCRCVLEGAVDLAIANFSSVPQGISLKDFYREEVVLLIKKAAFVESCGKNAAECERLLRLGDFTVLKNFAFLLGGSDDIIGHVGHSVLKRAGIDNPNVRVSSHNVSTLLSLCVLGSGACFCPENLARATLTPEQLSSLLLFRLDEEAQYPIRFGYHAQPYQWSVIESFMRCAENIVLQ